MRRVEWWPKHIYIWGGGVLVYIHAFFNCFEEYKAVLKSKKNLNKFLLALFLRGWGSVINFINPNCIVMCWCPKI